MILTSHEAKAAAAFPHHVIRLTLYATHRLLVFRTVFTTAIRRFQLDGLEMASCKQKQNTYIIIVFESYSMQISAIMFMKNSLVNVTAMRAAFRTYRSIWSIEYRSIATEWLN